MPHEKLGFEYTKTTIAMWHRQQGPKKPEHSRRRDSVLLHLGRPLARTSMPPPGGHDDLDDYGKADPKHDAARY